MVRDGRSVNPSLTDSRFVGGPTTYGNIETVRNSDGISADGSDFQPSPESSLSKSKTTLHKFVGDRAASYVI